MGKRRWHPATSASGKRTAQAFPGIRYARGIRLLEKTTIITMTKKLRTSDSQNRRRMRGTSMKKFDFSTSFFVAPHWILYEKRCASRAWDKWSERPPKKKKLWVLMRNANLPE